MRSKIVVMQVLVVVFGAAMVESQIELNFVPTEPLALGVAIGRVEGFGARGLGMGGAFLAYSDDATAALWNPAGLSQLSGTTVQVGGEYRRTDLLRDYHTENEGQGDLPFQFFREERSDSDSDAMLPSFITVAIPHDTNNGRWVIGASIVRMESFIDDYVFAQPIGLEVDIAAETPNWRRARVEYESLESRLIDDSAVDTYNLSFAYNYQDKFLVGVTGSCLVGARDIRKTDSAQNYGGQLIFVDEAGV